MGYLYISGKFSACLSRHNSVRDEEHNDLWLDFMKRIQEIADEDKYKSITLMTDLDMLVD